MRHDIYSPGAGHQPPLLVGREHHLGAWRRILDELAFRGRVGARDLILTGPRGVGKTVLLGRYERISEASGFEIIKYQPAVGQMGLVEALAKQAAKRLDERAGAWSKVRRSFEHLAGISFGAGGISATVSLRQAGNAAFSRDAADVAVALADLATAIRTDIPTGGVLLTVDELQVTARNDLSLLAVALHRLNVDHPDARVAFAATALPHIYSVLSAAGVTHPDRLFPVQPIPTTLTPDDATTAIVGPAQEAGVTWDPAAAAAVVRESGGYPAHLQLMASRTWEAAPEGASVITTGDAATGIAEALEGVEIATFAETWGELPDQPRRYLAALARNGGQATTRQMVTALGATKPTDLSSIREDLLRRGVIHAPRHGTVVFTIPAMAAFVRHQVESGN